MKSLQPVEVIIFVACVLFLIIGTLMNPAGLLIVLMTCVMALAFKHAMPSEIFFAIAFVVTASVPNPIPNITWDEHMVGAFLLCVSSYILLICWGEL